MVGVQGVARTNTPTATPHRYHQDKNERRSSGTGYHRFSNVFSSFVCADRNGRNHYCGRHRTRPYDKLQYGGVVYGKRRPRVRVGRLDVRLCAHKSVCQVPVHTIYAARTFGNIRAYPTVPYKMVEVVKFASKIKILLAILVAVPGFAAAQVQPRIAGLASNAEYMELLEQGVALKSKEDSLSTVISAIRNEFRTNPENRQHFAGEIMRIEGELFDVRNNMGIVAGKVNSIEQRFIIENLQSLDNIPETDSLTAVSIRRRESNISNLSIFKEKLDRQDYELLVRAGEKEADAERLAIQFIENYRNVKELDVPYSMAPDKHSADSIWHIYEDLRARGDSISGQLSTEWESISDSKLFAYNYLLDVLNETELRSSFLSKIAENRNTVASEGKKAESAEVVEYMYGKDLVMEYEMQLAKFFNLGAADDSLQKAKSRHMRFERNLPALDMEERLFLDFHAIETRTPVAYNSANPIPEVTIHPKGKIYRILLATYTRKQPVSIFKNLYPIAFQDTGDGKVSYYAGGYPTTQEAAQGLKKVQAAGFRNAKITVWNNGAYSVVEDEPTSDGQSSLFIIQIKSESGTLPATVSGVISSMATGKDVARVGDMFTVGPFHDKKEAEAVSEAIMAADVSVQSEVTGLRL